LACAAREVEDGSCTGRVLELADAIAVEAGVAQRPPLQEPKAA
jgi:hypothetical protein